MNGLLYIASLCLLAMALFLQPIRSRTLGDVGPHFTTTECPNLHRSCKTPSTSKQLSNPLLLTCSCSPSCFRDGDCCWDAPISEDATNPNIGRRQCVPLRGYQATSYYMIASCPRSWTDDTVRKYCELTLDDGRDDIQLVPVSSLKSQATYRNLFCAICNDDRSSSLVSWTVELACRPRTIAGKKILSDLLNKCTPQDVIPFSLNASGIGRPCEKSLISTCGPDSDKYHREHCETYFAPVKMSGKNYKNKFCAFCAGKSNSKLQCAEIKLRPHTQVGYSGLFIGQSHVKLIFAFDIRDGHSVIGTPKCEPNHLYINWSRQDKTQGVEEGRCIWIGSSNSSGKPYDISECPGEIKIYEHYTVDSEGTAVISENNLTLPKNSYHVLQNASLAVCVKAPPSRFEGVVFVVCIIVSLVALFLKVFIHFVVPEPKTVPNRSVMMLSCSLFMAQILLISGVNKTQNSYLCVAIGCLIHYFFLVSFCWTNVLAYDIHRKFSSLRHGARSSCSERKRLTRFSIYAWLTPLSVVGISLVFDMTNAVEALTAGYGDELCWFANKSALLVFFAAPLAAILVANIFFFLVTAYRIFKTAKEGKVARQSTCGRVERVRFVLYIKLALIMGLTWVFAFVAPYASSSVVWALFEILNGLQGTFIFLAFTDFKLNSNIRRLRSGFSRTVSTPSDPSTTPIQTETTTESDKKTIVKKSVFYEEHDSGLENSEDDALKRFSID